MILALVLLISATDPKLPAGISCDDVKAQVKEYGYAKSIIWARSHGFSWAQLAEAKKCLK